MLLVASIKLIIMIDPATGSIEIRSVPEARADLVANQVDPAWLTRYRLANKITVDRGKELPDKFKTMMVNDYRIPCSSISVRNPQANTIMEKVPQTIGNIIHSFKIQQIEKLRALGKEFSHLLCSPYGLRYTLLHSIHRHNCYLVGMQSLISTKKPIGN